jgi:hypothetical protein
MARKGDIESKSVASRIPMETYIKLLQISSREKKTISFYVAELIDTFIKHGNLEPKIIEVEKIVIDDSKWYELNKLYIKLKADYENLILSNNHKMRIANEYGDKIRVLEEELSKFRKI